MKFIIKTAVLVFGMLFASQAFAFTTVDCTNPTHLTSLGGITQVDCELLDSIYTDTNPAGWTDSTNWDTLTDVNGWFGIVESLGVMTSINLDNKGLVGTATTWVFPPNLETFDIRNNTIDGDISAWDITTGTSLEIFRININDFTGDIGPWNISGMTNLREFRINDNSFSGDLAGWILPPAIEVFLINGHPLLTGDISGWNITGASTLTDFRITNNSHTGDISGWVLPLNISFFSVRNNGTLTGDISSWVLPATLQNFQIFSNDLFGDISSWVLPANLSTMMLSNNNFEADISSWVMPSLLRVLLLTDNAFFGEIPDFTGATSMLVSSNINDNKFETATPGGANDLAADAALGENWSLTQTIAPENPVVSSQTATDVVVSVDAYEFNVIGDFNLRYGTTTTGPYTDGTVTTARSAGTDITVTGLTPNTVYYGVVEAETAANGGGNVLVATSTEFTMILSTAPDLATASDSGVSSTDDVTNDTTPTFEGSCAPTVADVTLYANGVAVGTDTCSAGGTYSITAAPALVDGDYDITTTQTVGGVEGPQSTILPVTIDSTDPAPTTSVDTTGGIDTPTINFSSVELGSGVERIEVEYLLDNGVGGTLAATNTIAVLGAGATSFNPVLDPDELTHEVRVRIYDIAGNVSESILRFPPLIDITAPTTLSDMTINDTTFTVTSPAGNDVGSITSSQGTVICNGGVPNNQAGPYASGVSCTLTGLTTTGNVSITAEDVVTSATGQAEQAYIIDNVGPVITVIDDVLVGPVMSDDFEVTITDAYPDTTTYEYGFSPDAVCDATDTYGTAITSGTPISFTTEANNGSYLCVIATDQAGNTTYGGSTNPLNIDITDPVMSITAPAPGDVTYVSATSTDADILVTGTGENGDSVLVDDGNGNVCSATVAGGVWSCTLSTVPLGAQTLTATETDPAGNTTTDTTNIEIKNTLDPVVITSVTTSGVTTGTSEPLAAITVEGPVGTTLCTTTADAAGNWSCTLAPLPTVTTALTVEEAIGGLTGTTTGTFNPAAATSSGGGSGSSKACRDPEALNYKTFGKSDPDRCIYEESTEEKVDNIVKENEIDEVDDDLIERLRALITEVLAGKVSPIQATETCPAFTQYMQVGDRDGARSISRQNAGVSTTISQVARLQSELKSQGFYNGPISGFFGTQTKAAVNAWQVEHRAEVLTPWGITQPTGWFYQSSERWMNELKGCDDSVRLDNGVQLN